MNQVGLRVLCKRGTTVKRDLTWISKCRLSDVSQYKCVFLLNRLLSRGFAAANQCVNIISNRSTGGPPFLYFVVTGRR